MKNLLIPLLLGLSLAFGEEPDVDSVPVPSARAFNWSIGVTFSPSQIGGFGEIVLRNLWAVQIQRFEYKAFEVPFGHHYSPTERYSMTSANVGAYFKRPHIKVGIFSGLGMADGVIHGKFFRSSSNECGMISCSGSESDYERIEGRTWVIPIKLVMGYVGESVGFAFAPQVGFHGSKALVNIPFSLEFGLP